MNQSKNLILTNFSRSLTFLHDYWFVASAYFILRFVLFFCTLNVTRTGRRRLCCDLDQTPIFFLLFDQGGGGGGVAPLCPP